MSKIDVVLGVVQQRRPKPLVSDLQVLDSLDEGTGQVDEVDDDSHGDAIAKTFDD